jgi:hypothetical protein
MTGSAIPEWCKGHCHQGMGRDNAGRGAPKGQKTERRKQMRQKGSSGIRDRALNELMHLESERTSSRFFRKDLVLEIVKQKVKYTCDSINIPYRESYEKIISWHMAVMTEVSGVPPLLPGKGGYSIIMP